MMIFVPDSSAAPRLYVGVSGHEFVFECRDALGNVEIQTYHAQLPDALHQVASRIRVEQFAFYRNSGGKTLNWKALEAA